MAWSFPRSVRAVTRQSTSLPDFDVWVRVFSGVCPWIISPSPSDGFTVTISAAFLERQSMLAVSEAQALVLQQAQPLPPETVPLSSDVLGRVLAEDVVSDLDMPPHDKALMDGYAVR